MPLRAQPVRSLSSTCERASRRRLTMSPTEPGPDSNEVAEVSTITSTSIIASPLEEGKADEEDDDEVCRYCFEGPEEGQMLSGICACRGDQKHVHLDCLRRWQRMVLVSQPTHPAFHQDDVRHHKCNVCGADFNIPPPTRHELMQSFTGAEIAALISEGCVMGSHQGFSEELERQMSGMPLIQRVFSSYQHWTRAVYLITHVSKDDGTVELPVRTDATLDRLRERLDDALSMDVGGRRHSLVPAGAMAGIAPERMADALRVLRAPATLVLSTGREPDCGEDHVVAVNLTRPVRVMPPDEEDDGEDDSEEERGEGEEGGGTEEGEDEGRRRRQRRRRGRPRDVEDDPGGFAAHPFFSAGLPKSWHREAYAAVEAAKASIAVKYPGASAVEVVHYLGGPCDAEKIVACVVPGGVRRGWSVVTADDGGLAAAIQLAHGRAVRRCDAQGEIHGGQTVRLRGLKARPDLNGEVGLALRFEPSTGRWLMRLRDGDGKQVKPENMHPMEGASGRVMAFWGDARWSRAQLLGEIARGHWGLCRGGVGDITASPEKRFEGLEGRLAFAPETEMTEDFMRAARREMAAFRTMGAAAEAEGGDGTAAGEAGNVETDDGI